LVLAWTFTGSRGAYIHVVEKLHSNPLGDMTITALTLFLFFYFTGGCVFGVGVNKDEKKKREKKNEPKKSTHRGPGDKRGIL
jgi:hypothetical protein